MTRFAALILLFMAGLRAAVADQAAVTIFAAASLRGALEEIAVDHAQPVALSFGGSGTMARQIAAGAPADAVILAHPQWMAWLETQGTALLQPPRAIASNRLVLIGQKGVPPVSGPRVLVQRLGTDRLAMGQRDAVPAGIYARQWLEAAGVWTALQDRLAETDNVRAALALVARGDAPLGLVYASDAAAEPGVDVLFEIPEGDHAPILYPAAALTQAGADFLAALQSPAGQAVFARRGFAPVPQ